MSDKEWTDLSMYLDGRKIDLAALSYRQVDKALSSVPDAPKLEPVPPIEFTFTVPYDQITFRPAPYRRMRWRPKHRFPCRDQWDRSAIEAYGYDGYAEVRLMSLRPQLWVAYALRFGRQELAWLWRRVDAKRWCEKRLSQWAATGWF